MGGLEWAGWGGWGVGVGGMMSASFWSSSYGAKKWTDSPGISTRMQRTGVGSEAGPQRDFGPGSGLYASFGFTFCGPFADYAEDPNSVVMTRTLPAPVGLEDPAVES